MKSIKESVYEYIQKELMKEDTSGITTTAVAQAFHMQRSNASAVLNELVREGKLNKGEGRPVLYSVVQKEEKDVFEKDQMIGASGSLASAVQIAKAAILYPGKSLNIMISAEPGCGTTYFASCLYRFAVVQGVLSKNAPYVRLNCRHYREDMHEIDEMIYDADGDFSGNLFVQADGGMLVIENCELLSGSQRRQISDYLDMGKITGKDRKNFRQPKVILVLSSSPENAGKLVIKTPMTAYLPPLRERPMDEKKSLVDMFFHNEAVNAGRNIEVSREVMESILLSDYDRNIKEMATLIKKACATACVRVIDTEDSCITVTDDDFPAALRKSRMHVRLYDNPLYDILGNQNLFVYEFSGESRKEGKEDLYGEIYSLYNELLKRGVSRSAVQEVLHTHVGKLFRKYSSLNARTDIIDTSQLSKIVDARIIEAVETLMKTVRRELNRELKSSVFYGLCLHMNSLLSVKMDQSRVNNSQVVHIVQDYPDEYALSSQFVKQFEDMYDVKLPIEETVLVTMFLIQEDDPVEEHPKLLYVFHGAGVASSLCEVTNALTHLNNAYAYDLLLDKKSDEAYAELKELVSKIDRGKGIIAVYDMGSIQTILEGIAEELHVSIRYLYFPITLTGLDVAHKCAQSDDVDYIYHTVLSGLRNLRTMTDGKTKVIITLCNTGEGGAAQLKSYIDQYSSLGIQTVAMAISDRSELVKRVIALRKAYDIHCFVGTFDPKLFGIPFIPISRIFENSPEVLDRILMFEPVSETEMDYEQVYEFLESQLHAISIAKLKTVLPGIIDRFEMIYSLDKDQKLGLFVHIATMTDRCRAGIEVFRNPNTEKIIAEHEDDFRTVSELLRPLEKQFKIIVPDHQIADIIAIVDRL